MLALQAVSNLILTVHLHTGRSCIHSAGHDKTVHMQAIMRSEDAARAVQKRYQDCALDGKALKVQLTGTQATTVLKSGLAVQKVRGGGAAAPAARQQAGMEQAGQPRGRGVSGSSGGMRAW